VLGFRPDALHVVTSDDRFRLRPEPVAAAIDADRDAGRTPFAISAVAGSTNTGSVDDVVGLASLVGVPVGVGVEEGVGLALGVAVGEPPPATVCEVKPMLEAKKVSE
jgi:hypothetical protein